jgi:membrane associated rhomboid family serine protease
LVVLKPLTSEKMRTSIFDEIKDFFIRGSILSRLIGINVAIFILVGLVRVVFFLIDAQSAYPAVLHWFGVPSHIEHLLVKPWTLITYMFLHFDFFHIFFNMLMLYIGGRLFREFLGENRLIGTYVLGGLAGGLFFIASYNIFPAFASDRFMAVAIGASASVLAIFISIAVFMPNYQLPLLLLGRIRLKYIAVFFIIIDLLSIDKGNSGGHLAHLGGALWGFIYIALLRRGLDPGRHLSAWISAIGSIFRPKPRMRVEYRSNRPLTDDNYNKQRAENQKKLDRILDKISKHGYDSLSSEEKEILFRMSNKN